MIRITGRGVAKRLRNSVAVRHGPARAHVRWYAQTWSDADGIWAQELLATGLIRDREAVLVDITGAEQGRYTLPADEPDVVVAGAYPAVGPELRALVQDVDRASQSLPPEQRFASVAVYEGGRVVSLPLVWYPVLALQVQPWLAQPQQLLLFVERMVLHALAFSTTSTSLEQLLVDTLAMPTHAWVYRPDRLLDGRSDVDCWASPWTFPGPGPVAFDCEDGSHAALQLFHAFRQMAPPPPSRGRCLRALHALAQEYDAWMAIAELKVGEGSYQMHCMLMLFQRETTSTVVRPVLTLEATTFASGAWHCLQQPDETARAQFGRAQAAADAMQPPSRRELARVRAPLCLVREQRMYRHVVALFGCTTQGRTRHHLLPAQTDIEALLRPGPLRLPAGTRTPVDVATAELQAWLQPHLDLQPVPAVPALEPDAGPRPKAGSTCVLWPSAAGSPTALAGTHGSRLEWQVV